MDSSVVSFGGVLIINIIIFIILVLIWTCCHQRRTAPHADISKKYRSQPKPGMYDESEMSCGEIWKKVRETTDDEIAEKASVEALLYLKLQRMLAQMLTIFAVIGAIILCPIYYIGGGDSDSTMQMITISNIGDDMLLGLAPPAALVVFSIIAYMFVFKYVRDIRNFSSRLASENSSSVLELYGFPGNESPKDMEETLKSPLVEKFGDKIVDVYVLPNYCLAYKHLKKREALQDKLDHFIALNEQKGKQHKVATWCLCCSKRDAVEYHEEKISDETEKFNNAKSKYANDSTQLCFVICRSEAATYEVLDEINSLQFKFGALESVRMAPDSNNVLWQNVNSNRRASAIKGCCLTLIFFIIVFFLCTPTTFIKYVTLILESTPLSVIADLIGNFLPVILLIVYMSVIIPAIIWFLVGLEKHHNTGSAINSGMNKFLLFFSLNIFIFPTIITPIIGAILGGDGLDSLHETLPAEVTSIGIMFAYFNASQAFLANGFVLLAIGRLIGPWLKNKNAASEKEKDLVWVLNEFDTAKFYAIWLTVMIVTMGYLVTVPLVAIFGAIYFWIHYSFDKYNMLTIFYINFESNGMTPRQALKFLIFSIFMFQLFTSLLIMTVQNMIFLAIGGACLLLSIIILFWMLWQEKRIFGAEVRNEPKEKEEDLNDLKQKYTHPAEGDSGNDYEPKSSRADISQDPGDDATNTLVKPTDEYGAEQKTDADNLGKPDE